MHINNIYIGTLSIVTDYDFGDNNQLIIYSQKDRNALLYHQGNECYVDVFTKEKYQCNSATLNRGQKFVDLKNYRLIPFTEVIDKLENINKTTIKIGMNPSERKIKKVLRKYSKNMEV